LANRDDVVEETHVEHAIGFIKDQRLERGQRKRAAFEVIHDPPGVSHGKYGSHVQRLAICGRIGEPPHSVRILMLSSARAIRRISCVT